MSPMVITPSPPEPTKAMAISLILESDFVSIKYLISIECFKTFYNIKALSQQFESAVLAQLRPFAPLSKKL
jgi:hypothetical protein